MADGGYYRAEAQRCRDLAATTRDSRKSRRWSRLADEYAVLAEELDARINHRPPILMHPQPIQQQQSKARPR